MSVNRCPLVGCLPVVIVATLLIVSGSPCAAGIGGGGRDPDRGIGYSLNVDEDASRTEIEAAGLDAEGILSKAVLTVFDMIPMETDVLTLHRSGYSGPFTYTRSEGNYVSEDLSFMETIQSEKASIKGLSMSFNVSNVEGLFSSYSGSMPTDQANVYNRLRQHTYYPSYYSNYLYGLNVTGDVEFKYTFMTVTTFNALQSLETGMGYYGDMSDEYLIDRIESVGRTSLHADLDVKVSQMYNYYVASESKAFKLSVDLEQEDTTEMEYSNYLYNQTYNGKYYFICTQHATTDTDCDSEVTCSINDTDYSFRITVFPTDTTTSKTESNITSNDMLKTISTDSDLYKRFASISPSKNVTCESGYQAAVDTHRDIMGSDDGSMNIIGGIGIFLLIAVPASAVLFAVFRLRY